jgi:hypothetical protein
MRKILQALMRAQRLLREMLASAWSFRESQTRDKPSSEVLRVGLCDTQISLEVRRFGTGGYTYVNLHENERTSICAALAVLGRRPGRLIELKAAGRRYVAFRDAWRPYVFDPNRIFTDAGAEQTLDRYASLTPVSRAAVAKLRDTVLELLENVPKDEPVIALHNNAGGMYSILEYGPGGAHSGNAAELAVCCESRPEDFFLVTDSTWFARLKALRFNVVLQSPQAPDDGSLSIWFQRSGRAYINVEAKHDRLDEQTRMLLAVASSC